MTAGVGMVLGAIWSLLTGHFVSQTLILNATAPGAPAGRTLLVAVLFPLLAQALMLAGPVILRFTRPQYDALDGFAFGAASALGFVFASTLVYLAPLLQAGPIAIDGSTLFALRSLLHGLLVPLIDVGTTGLASAALWLHRRERRSLPGYNWVTSLWTAIAAAAAIQVGLGIVDVEMINATSAILIYVAVAVVLLLWVRMALHFMLLADAGQGGQGPATTCPFCGRSAPRNGFCPNCGIAIRGAANPDTRTHNQQEPI